MIEFKGTKGPWKMAGESISGNKNFNIIGTVVGGRHKIARVPFNHDPSFSDNLNVRDKSEAEANAKLIAAAPELLEIVKHFVDEFWSGDHSKEMLNKAEILIDNIYWGTKP